MMAEVYWMNIVDREFKGETFPTVDDTAKLTEKEAVEEWYALQDWGVEYKHTLRVAGSDKEGWLLEVLTYDDMKELWRAYHGE